MATNRQNVFSKRSLPYCWKASRAFAISSFFRWASLAASSFADDFGRASDSCGAEVAGVFEDGSVDACRGALSNSYKCVWRSGRQWVVDCSQRYEKGPKLPRIVAVKCKSRKLVYLVRFNEASPCRTLSQLPSDRQ